MHCRRPPPPLPLRLQPFGTIDYLNGYLAPRPGQKGRARAIVIIVYAIADIVDFAAGYEISLPRHRRVILDFFCGDTLGRHWIHYSTLSIIIYILEL